MTEWDKLLAQAEVKNAIRERKKLIMKEQPGELH